jgi:hypothetical protein
VTISGNNAKAYAQAELVGTIDQLVDLIQGKTGAAMPGTDLLLSNAYDEMMSNVIAARHIGQGVIDGVECEHLSFRGVDTTGKSGSRAARGRSPENTSSPARR